MSRPVRRRATNTGKQVKVEQSTALASTVGNGAFKSNKISKGAIFGNPRFKMAPGEDVRTWFGRVDGPSNGVLTREAVLAAAAALAAERAAVSKFKWPEIGSADDQYPVLGGVGGDLEVHAIDGAIVSGNGIVSTTDPEWLVHISIAQSSIDSYFNVKQADEGRIEKHHRARSTAGGWEVFILVPVSSGGDYYYISNFSNQFSNIRIHRQNRDAYPYMKHKGGQLIMENGRTDALLFRLDGSVLKRAFV